MEEMIMTVKNRKFGLKRYLGYKYDILMSSSWHVFSVKYHNYAKAFSRQNNKGRKRFRVRVMPDKRAHRGKHAQNGKGATTCSLSGKNLSLTKVCPTNFFATNLKFSHCIAE